MITEVNFLKKEYTSICCMYTEMEIENEHIMEVLGENKNAAIIYWVPDTCRAQSDTFFMEFSQPWIAVFPILPVEKGSLPEQRDFLRVN